MVNGRERIKQENKKQVLQVILKNKNCTIQDIVFETGLSVPTITGHVKELEVAGLVKMKEQLKATAGRSARVVEGISKAVVAVGIDLTPHHINIVLVGLDKNVIYSSGRKVFLFQNNEEYYISLAKQIENILDQEGISPKAVVGCGVSLPAILDAACKNLPYAPILENPMDILTMFEKYLKYPVRMINDANAGALSEIALDNQSLNAVYLYLSNSVGGAIISDNKLNVGDHNRSGEFGHMRMGFEGRRCYCGKDDCLDCYCSTRLLSKPMKGSLDDFFAEVRAGNQTCIKIWEEYISYMVVAIDTIRLIFDVDVILGGYLSAYLEPYLDEIRKRVSKRNMFKDDASFINISYHKLNASAVGAALLCIDDYYKLV